MKVIKYVLIAFGVLVVLVIFAYPLCYAVYMSFFDYFFAAPGANVTQPFVGFDNYVQVVTDNDGARRLYERMGFTLHHRSRYVRAEDLL